MRILFINPVSAYMRGGGEINDLNLAGALRKEGHDVIHVDAVDPRIKSIDYPDECPVESVQLNFFYGKALRWPSFIGKFFRGLYSYYFLQKLKSQKQSLLNSADLILLTGKPILSKLKHFTSAEVLLSIRGQNHSYMYSHYRRADGVIFWGGCDEGHPDSIKKILNMLALNPAIEKNIFKLGKAKKKYRDIVTQNKKGVTSLLYVGRLDPVHQVNTIINAVAYAVQNGQENLVLNIVGSGADIEALKGLANDLLPGMVQFLGRRSREEVAEFHRASDVFLINPIHTNHPIALKEAVACGSYALAPKLGRVEKILKNNCFSDTFDPNDQKNLNDCLLDTLNNSKYEADVTLNQKEVYVDSWEKNASEILTWHAQKQKTNGKKLAVLCDQSVDKHFPAHFYKVYGEQLKSRGYDLSVVAFCRQSDHEDVVRRKNEGVVILEKNIGQGLLGRVGYTFSLIKKLFGVMRNPKISKSDVYLVHNDPVLGIFVYVWARLNKKKMIYRLTHLIPEEAMICEEWRLRFMGRVSQVLRNWLLKRCDYILPTSPVACEIIASQLPQVASKMSPLVAMVDADEKVSPADEVAFIKKAAEIKSRMKEYPCKEWMVYLGTLSPNRELSLMIDTLKVIRETTQRKTGLLVFGVTGRPGDLEKLVSYATERNVMDHIIWADPVTEQCLPFVVSLADIGLSPFPVNSVVRANSPLKTLEYIRSGVPVVGSPIPNHEETIEQSGAGLIANNNADDYAKAVISILSETKTQRAERVQKAQGWVRQNRNLPNACDIIEEAIKKSQNNNQKKAA